MTDNIRPAAIPSLSRPIRVFVLIGGIWGLVCAIGMSVIRAVNSNEAARSEELVGNIAFAIAYAAPFILSLWALRLQNSAEQAAIWFAGGTMAILASFSAFSGVSLVFVPAGPFLISSALAAAAYAWRNAGVGSTIPILPVSFGLVIIGVSAFILLIVLTPDPRCWVENRYADGHTAWEFDPVATAGMHITTGPNGETTVGGGSTSVGGPAVNGVQRLASMCASDIISPLEGAVSAGLWVLTFVGLLAIGKIWRGSAVLA